MPLALPQVPHCAEEFFQYTYHRSNQPSKLSTHDDSSQAEHHLDPSQLDTLQLRLLPYHRDLITIHTQIPNPPTTEHWQIASRQPRTLLSTFSSHLSSRLADKSVKELYIDNDKIDTASVRHLCTWMANYCRGILTPTDAAPYDWHDRFAFWFLAQCWHVEAVLTRLSSQLRTDLACVQLDTALAALDEARTFGRQFKALAIIDGALYRLVSFWVADVWDLNMLRRHRVSERVLNRAIQRFYLLNRTKYPEPGAVPHFDRLHWTTRQRLVNAYGKDTLNPLKRRIGLRCR